MCNLPLSIVIDSGRKVLQKMCEEDGGAVFVGILGFEVDFLEGRVDTGVEKWRRKE